MNKIFRVIWNHATQSWVAVSELQPAKGKTKSVSAAVAAAVVVAGAALVSDGVLAATTVAREDTVFREGEGPDIRGTLQLGSMTAADGNSVNEVRDSTMLIGKGASVLTYDRTNGDNGVLGYNHVVIGEKAYAVANNSVVLGNNAVSGAVGYRDVTEYAVGSSDASGNLVVGVNATANARESVAIGYNAKTNDGSAEEYERIPGLIAVGANAVAAGQRTHVSRGNPSNKVAAGYEHPTLGRIQAVEDSDTYTGADGSQFVDKYKFFDLNQDGKYKGDGIVSAALGHNAYAKNGSTAVGSHASAPKGTAVAVGALATATGISSTAVGTASYAAGNTAIAIGRAAAAAEDHSVAVGMAAGAAELGTVAIGHSALANKFGAVAIGTSGVLSAKPTMAARETPEGNLFQPQLGSKYLAATQTLANGTYSTAIGPTARALDTHASALGAYANASSVDSSAIGFDALAEGRKATAIGSASYAKGEQAVALADNARSVSNRSVAIGANSKAFSDDTVAIGMNAIAGATLVTDALKAEIAAAEAALVAQRHAVEAAQVKLQAASEKVNNAGAGLTQAMLDEYEKARRAYDAELTKLDEKKTALITANDKLGKGKNPNAVAIGKDTVASDTNALAVGAESYTDALNAGTFGYKNKVYEGAKNGYAAGVENVIGTATDKKFGVDAFAFGYKNTVEANSSVAIGSNNQILKTAEGAMVLGNNVRGVSNKGSVVLGNNSAEASPTKETSATVGGVTYGNFFAPSKLVADGGSAVSVGAGGQERQIQNVAAGRIAPDSSDAVNGSQLYVVYDRLLPAPENDIVNGKLQPVKEPAGENGRRFVNSTTLTNLINNAGWNLNTAKGAGEHSAENNPALVKKGNTVTVKAGSGIELTQAGKDITIAANTTGGNPGNFYVSNADGSTKIAVEKPSADEEAVIDFRAGVNGHLTRTYDRAGDGETNNPSVIYRVKTLADKHAGELQNGKYVFTDGTHENGLVTSQAMYEAINNSLWYLQAVKNNEGKLDGKVSRASLSRGNIMTLNAGEHVKLARDGKKVTISVEGEQKAKADIEVSDGVASIANGGGNDDLPKAGNVAKMINQAGHKVGLGNSDEQVTAADNTEGVIAKAGTTLKFVAGNNLVGAQEANTRDLGFSLADEIKVNSVKTDTAKIGDVTFNENGMDANGTTVTNVGDGTDGTDAVNVSQLKAHKWKLTSGKTDGGDHADTTAADADKLVGKDDEVKFIAGDNIKIKQAARDLTVSIQKAKVLNVTATGKVDEPANGEGSKLITAGNVADLVNNSYWVIGNGKEVNKVKAGSEVNFVDNDNGVTSKVEKRGGDTATNVSFSITADDKTVTVNKEGKLTAVTHDIVINNDGKVNEPTGDEGKKLVNATEVADAINNSSYKVATLNSGAEVAATNDKATEGQDIKAGDKLVYAAGKNLVVKQEGQVITFGLAKDITVGNVTANSTKFGPVEINENGTKAGDKVISNVAEGTDPTDAVNVGQLTREVEAQKWKLTTGASGNGEVSGTSVEDIGKDDEVKFIAGDNIKIKQAARDLTVLIQKAPNLTVKGGKVDDLKDPKDGSKLVTAGNVADMVNETYWVIGNGTEVNKVKAGSEVNFVDNDSGVTSTVAKRNKSDAATNVSFSVDFGNATTVTNGKLTANDGGKDKAISSQELADTINRSGWIVTSDVDGGVRAKDGDKKEDATVNPGNEVTFIAGKNLKIKQDGKNFTYLTQNDVSFTSVAVGKGDNIVKFTTSSKDPNVLELGNKTGAPVAITNVKAGAKVFESGDLFDKGTPADKAFTGLLNLDDSEGTNVFTVKDAKNLGWVVSTIGDKENPGNDYISAVRHPQRVDFAGKNMANVTGEYVPFDENKPEEGGVHVVTVDVNAQKTVNNSVFPVVYTKEDGTQVYKQPDGSFNSKPNGDGDKFEGKVIASMNKPGANSTTTPITLSNVQSTLDPTYNKDALNPDNKAVSQKGKLPEGIESNLSNAATVSDVMNAGWNLQENGTAKDFVKPYDTVNFKDAESKLAKVNVTTEAKGLESVVKFEVDTKELTKQLTGSVTTNKRGQAETTFNAEKPFASVEEVKEAINKSGWFISSKDANGKDAETFVKAGSTVNFVGTGSASIVTKLGDNGKPEITFKVDGDKIIKEASGNVTVNSDGSTTVDTKNAGKIATTDTVSNAINNAGWRLTIGRDDEKFEQPDNQVTTPTLINPDPTTGNLVTFKSGKNLKVKQDGKKITYALAEDLKVNEVVIGARDGKPGVNGELGVTGKNGANVQVNGKDGSIGLTGPRGENGKDGASATIKLAEGKPGIKGNDGQNGKTRIVYETSDGKGGTQTEEIATLNDGLYFAGNQGNTIAKTLGETLNVEGGLANDADASADNVRVDSEGGKLIVKVAEKPVFKGITVTEGDNTAKLEVTDNGLKVGDKNGKPTKVTNVNKGKVTVDSKEAVNGSQLYQVKDTVDAGWNLSVNKGQNSAPVKPKANVDLRNSDNNIAISKEGNNVNFDLSKNVDLTDNGTLEVGGITINNQGIDMGNKVIKNVLPGEKDSDAANYGQLKNIVNHLDNKINARNKDLRAGVAGSNAAAGLPQVYIPGKSMISAAAGAFKGQSAIAVGYSRASDNGKLLLRIHGNANSRGNYGGAVSLGYQW